MSATQTLRHVTMDDTDPAHDPETGGLTAVAIDMYAPSETGSFAGHGVLSSGMTAEELRDVVRSELDAAKEEKKKKMQQTEAYPRPAFEAFRKAFKDGPIVTGPSLTSQELEQWSANFLAALDADEKAAAESAMNKVRPRLVPVEDAIAKIVVQKRKAHEDAEAELQEVLSAFDAQAEAATLLANEERVVHDDDAGMAARRQETERVWRENKAGEIESRFASEYNPLVVSRERLLREVDADLKSWTAQTKRYRARHTKLRAEKMTLINDAHRARKAEEVRTAVIRNVSDRAGEGAAADVAVLASSVAMGAMVKISHRKTLYAILWKIATVVLVLALLAGGYYAWKTRAIHALLRRGQTFRRTTTTVGEQELLSEPPRPETDYDHFFWMRNATGVCIAVPADGFAKNRVAIPWSDGSSVEVTLSAVNKWLSMYAGKSTCFCAQHIGLGLRAMRLYKDGEPYVLFNPSPVLPDMAQALCNPKLLADDVLVRFSDTVREQWTVEDDGPPPDWVQNPSFRFPQLGIFSFFDWKGRPQKIYLDDGGAACYGYCETLCK